MLSRPKYSTIEVVAPKEEEEEMCASVSAKSPKKITQLHI